MDKLFKKSWFVKLLSFLVALMLYTYVSSEYQGAGDQTSPITSGNQTETLQQKLIADYDQDKYVVSGLPDTVTVQIKGSGALILKTKLLNNRKAFVNLEGKGPGTYEVKVQTDGFPNDLKVNVIPLSITVTIQKKVTESLPVSIDLLNESKVSEGYTLEDTIIEPKRISVTGGKKLVDTIAFIKGVVDVKDAKDAIEKDVTINAYDKDGNQINIQIDPAVVHVKVPVTSPSKTVPIKLTKKASLPDGISIESIEMDPTEVTVFGSLDVLDSIDNLDGLTIDLSEISKDTTLEINVPVPEGAQAVEPKTVKVKINISEEISKTISDEKISVKNRSDDTTVDFTDPKDQLIDIVLKGSKAVLDKINSSDVEAYIDVSGLSSGSHTVAIKVNAPKNVDWQLTNDEAQITVTDNASS